MRPDFLTPDTWILNPDSWFLAPALFLSFHEKKLLRRAAFIYLYSV